MDFALMRFLLLFALLFGLSTTGLAQQLSTPRPIDLFIAIAPGECSLLETGIGFGDELEANKKAGMVAVKGVAHVEEPDVHRCSVEIAEEPLKSGLSQCALSGFNATSTLFYNGDLKRLTRACTVYRLRNGNLYFSATGIASDLCAWSCMLK